MKPLTFLIVEDDDSIRARIAGILNKALGNIVLVEASDGREGLQRFKSGRADIVVTGCHLHDMNGLEMVLALREISRSVLIVLLSSDEEMHELSLSCGANAFCSKNALNRLPAMITDLLHRRWRAKYHPSERAAVKTQEDHQHSAGVAGRSA